MVRALALESHAAAEHRVRDCGRERSGMQLLDRSRPAVKQLKRAVDEDASAALSEGRTVASQIAGKAGTARIPSPAPIADDAFSAVFESSGEALVLSDSSGTIHRANPRARQVLGLGEGSARGATLGMVLAERSGERALLLCDRRNAEKRSTIDASLASGQAVRITLRAALAHSRDLLLCVEPAPAVQGAGWKLRETEAELRSIQAKMLQTEKMAAVGQLVSGIAHELNSPLTAILGYAQLLLGHGLKPDQLEEAKKVYQEAERARRIVKNLLYFGRENQPERRSVDMNEVIERTLALRSYELKVENIEVKCHLARDLPHTQADPYQLQQVILNLLLNAEQALVEARGRGRVTIRTRLRPEAKTMPGDERKGERIGIEIGDNGPGIPAEVVHRIFDPFFTTKPPGVGTGLGLSIVYGIVHQHGGEISVETQPELGTKFSIELPVIDACAEPLPEASRQNSAHLSAIGSARILVIEDEPTVAQLMVDVLSEEGHRVEAVLDGKEGLTRIARVSYDVLICDLRMPGLDGSALYDSLQRAGSSLCKKLLFVTGDTLGPQTLEFLLPRKLPYLAKPFLLEELKLAVHQLLQSSEKNAEKATSASGERT